MPEPYALLPFPVGTTYTQGAVDPEASLGKDVVGRVYRIANPNNPSEELWLGVARYVGASNLTAAQKVIKFVAGKAGLEFDGYVDTNGGVGKPLDPALAGQTIKPNDLVYYVEKGTVTVGKAAGSVLTAGANAFSNDAGVISGAVTSGFPIGEVAADAASAATTCTVRVEAGFIREVAAEEPSSSAAE